MGEKLKILVTASTFPRSRDDSAPRFILDFCRSLNATGVCACTVLCPHSCGSAVSEEMEGVRVRRYRYMFPSSLEKLSKGGIVASIKRNKIFLLLVPFFLAGQLVVTFTEIRRLKPDLIIANWVVPQGLTAALVKVFMPRLNIVMISHGGDSAFIQGNSIFRLLGRFALNKADSIVAVSCFIRERLSLVTDVDRNRITVAPMGVDDSLFKAKKTQNRDDTSLLFVGRLEEKKGLVYLIEAMTKVLQKCPEVVLRIVGDGTQKTRLQQLTSEKGLSRSVLFVGAVEHPRLPAFFEKSAVFVAPSVNLDYDVEGLPVVLLEAIASGLPVITTDAGGITDIIEDGITGILVPQRNADHLADSIVELLEDRELREKIALRASVKLRERFTWEAVAKKYFDVITEVCGDSSTKG